jgi:hypothetical protein
MLAWLGNLLKGIFNKSGMGNFIIRVVPVHYRKESSQLGAPLKVAAWRCSKPIPERKDFGSGTVIQEPRHHIHSLIQVVTELVLRIHELGIDKVQRDLSQS